MIVVAFPGGAGGHFLGYAIKSLLKQQPVDSTAVSNFHRLCRPDQSFLNFSLLDPTQTSQDEELCYIHDIKSSSKLVLGHFRNIDAVVKTHRCQVILVQVSDADHDLLVARVMREAIDSVFGQVKYQDVRGEDWPIVNPGFAKLPRWIQLEIQSQLYKMFYYWNSNTQCFSSSVLKLSTYDIFHGTAMEKISQYLDLPLVPGLEQLHTNYKQLVRQKYSKYASSTL